MCAAVICVTWAVALVIGLWIAAETKVGPVLLSFAGGHGVHLGDVAGFLVCGQSAALITVVVRGDARRRH